MKVALVHYWLVSMRGGERVLESLCRMFPDADVFTHVVDRNAISRDIASHRIETTFISRLPRPLKMYQRYLPLMPQALEALDLSDYDLIISNEAGPAKGIIPGPNTVHLCYCCSPMRYIWDQYHVYRRNAGWFTRAVMPPLAHYLRLWDVSAAARVDHFLADSHHVAKRIGKFYHRRADVVYPPVAVDAFRPARADEIGDYYLWAGQLVSYKRPDIAVEAFRRNGRKLLVIGEGEERGPLEKGAPANVQFLGAQPFSALQHHFARCRALIFPGEEDFGIVPVEVQAAGRPVIAYGKGGALETVKDGETGILFPDCSADGLAEGIERFEASGLADTCRDACVANASLFSERHFQDGIANALAGLGVLRSERRSAPVPVDPPISTVV